eukprot:scaffold138_cov30-Tisochrysis_lutea.AAC.3
MLRSPKCIQRSSMTISQRRLVANTEICIPASRFPHRGTLTSRAAEQLRAPRAMVGAVYNNVPTGPIALRSGASCAGDEAPGVAAVGLMPSESRPPLASKAAGEHAEEETKRPITHRFPTFSFVDARGQRLGEAAGNFN